jgi:hypothetical protein
MLVGWHDGVGPRRVTGMMTTSSSLGDRLLYRRIGAAPASRATALRGWQQATTLVFPEDLDACRPFYEPRAVTSANAVDT